MKRWTDADCEALVNAVEKHGMNYKKILEAYHEHDQERSKQSILSQLAGIRSLEHTRRRYSDDRFKRFLEIIDSAGRQANKNTSAVSPDAPKTFS